MCLSRKSYYPADAYAQSKLAQILFTRFVDAQLKEQNDNVCIYAVHPGVVNTALFDTTGMQAIPWFREFFFKVRDMYTYIDFLMHAVQWKYIYMPLTKSIYQQHQQFCSQPLYK